MPDGNTAHRSVLILSAEVGEGHAAAARAMAASVHRSVPDAVVSIVDGVAPLGRAFSWCVQRGYRRQLQSAPSTYGLLYGLASRSSWVRGLMRTLIVAVGARRLRRLIAASAPDVVVSTYPATTMVLGELRRRGRLSAPACAVITDFTGLSFWSDRSIDMHLVMYAASAREVADLVGAERVTLCAPLVDAAFGASGLSSVAARAALNLPPDGHVVVVSGGGWGVGNLQGATTSALNRPDVHVVCVAGRNTGMQKRLTACFCDEPRVTVLGFTERMPEVLVAADVVVHTTAGVTCLEAAVCGRPVVAFEPPAGHPRVIARAMAEAGLVTLADGPAELADAFDRLIGSPQPTSRNIEADAGQTVVGLAPGSPAARRIAPAALQGVAACSMGTAAWLGIGVIGEGDLRGPALLGAVGLLVRATRGAAAGLLAS